MKRFKFYLLFCVLLSLGATFGLAHYLIQLKNTEKLYERSVLETLAAFEELKNTASEYQAEFKNKIENRYLEGGRPEPILEQTIHNLLESHQKLQRFLDDPVSKNISYLKEMRNWNETTKDRFLKFHHEVFLLVSESQPRFERLQTTVDSFKKWKSYLEAGIRAIQKLKEDAIQERKQNILLLQRFSLLLLFSIVWMAFGFLWFSEKMLKPVRVLNELIRSLKNRGLNPLDREALLMLPRLQKNDVSELAKEFYDMTTSLLERERTVEYQKARLSEQNILLKSLGEMNAKILDQMKSGFLVFDRDRKIKRFNEMVERLEAKQEGDILGKDYREFPLVSKMIEDATQGETREYGKFGPLYLGDTCYSGYIQVLEFPHDYMLMFFDVTEQMYLQDRLRNAEKLAAIGRMSAQVAHEIRNPLHAIGLEAELVQETFSRLEVKFNHSSELLEEREIAKSSLVAILSSVRRLEKITSNYLRLSKLSTGIREVVNISLLVEEIVHSYEALAKEKSIFIRIEREFEGDIKAYIDQMLFVQAIGNLIQNSIQSLESIKDNFPRLITIRLGYLESGKILILVRDNGTGISEQVKSKLFQPFVTTKAEGTGLGLSFVKQTFLEMGGDIHLSGAATLNDVRPGTQFEITLPPLQQSEERTKTAWPPVFSKEN